MTNSNASTLRRRALRLTLPWVGLALWLACGGNQDDDAPAPVAPIAADPATQGADPTAQPGQPSGVGSQRMFSLRPGFTPDPARSTGEARGTFPARTRGGDQCAGFVGAIANHTLNLGADFANLRILVNAPQDTTLMVQMADGSFRCNDDAEGLNPIVQGPFPRGIHRVYVGSYAQGQNTPYVLGVSELASVTTATLGGAGPTGGLNPTAPTMPSAGGGVHQPTTHSFRSGFMPDPQTARGVAGGSVSAIQWNPNCRGHVTETPNHTVQLQGDFRNFRILVNAERDTTLVVRAPDGTYRCNDDAPGQGFNPVVEGAFGPGAYQVWVGTYSQATAGAPYVIGFSELSSVDTRSLGN